MMKPETLKRLYKAKEYQKMALKALLPESAAGHLDVIERECKALFMDCLAEAAGGDRRKPEERQSGPVKKVNID